jgi:nickel/cobalt transporter (NiCoT) family protein
VLGYGIIVLFVVSWAASYVIYRVKGYDTVASLDPS